MSYVYAIVDPVTSQVQYVGCAKDPHARFKHHLYNSHNLGLRGWINKMAAKGIAPRLEILEAVEYERPFDVEAKWIAKCKKDNPQLFNRSSLTATSVRIPRTEKVVIRKMPKKLYNRLFTLASNNRMTTEEFIISTLNAFTQELGEGA